MSSHQTDRHHFERQIVYARPIFILLALLAVLEQPLSRGAHRSASFLIAYLIAALLITQIERLLRERSWHLPLACDLLALGFFMYTSPSTVPVHVSLLRRGHSLGPGTDAAAGWCAFPDSGIAHRRERGHSLDARRLLAGPYRRHICGWRGPRFSGRSQPPVRFAD